MHSFVPRAHTISTAHNTATPAARIAAATLFVGALLLPTIAAHAQGSDRVTFTGKSIAVYNLVGRLRVSGGGTSATATITRHGRDASKLTVATGAVEGRDALRIVYPGDRITIPEVRGRHMRTEMRVRDDGTFGNRYSDRSDNRRSFARSFSDGRRVRIGDESGGIEASADIDLQVPEGTSMRLHLGVGEVEVRNVNGDIAVDASGADVTLTDVSGTLTVDTGSGKSSLTNVSGLISLDTGSGDVVARNVSGRGLTIDSGSGSVTLDGCKSSKVSIDTGSGGLHVTEMIADQLALDTGSGDVVLGLRNSPEVITIDSGSGDVTLTLPADFGAQVDIDTGSGGITSDFSVQVTTKSRDSMRGRIGRGDGRLTIETGSGSVRLKKGN